METTTNLLPKHHSARVNWLLKEVIAWILVVGIFTTLLTYIYIWPYVVLSGIQLAALWMTGGISTLIPFFQKYFQALNLRYEQDLLIRFAFIIPTFISVLLLINYCIPVSMFQETHAITGTYEIIIYKKKKEINYIGLNLENNAYKGIEKIRTIDPRNVLDTPQQITYTFKRGIVGIKTIESFSIQ